jgi:hypothetical protein
MTFILIVLIELLIIIILSMCIKGLYKERVKVHANMKRLREQTALTLATHNEKLLAIAEAVRIYVSQILYHNKLKKNWVAREACTRFYNELERKLKNL